MEGIRRILRLAIDALVLRDDAYRAMRDDPGGVEKGVVLIVTIGVAVALAGLVGGTLTGYTMPDILSIQDTVVDGVLDLLALQDGISTADLDEARLAMDESMDRNRTIMPFFQPNLIGSLSGIVTKPVGMIVSWLIYGVLAFAVARLLGGRGTLSQTYGTTALAASPQLLGVFGLLPYVGTAGLGTWALICNYLAIKHTHGLSPGRTFWATLVPFLAPVALVFLLVAMGIAFAIAIGVLAS